jgi:hypothetical protein
MTPEAFQEVFAAGGVEGRDRVGDSECDTKHERRKIIKSHWEMWVQNNLLSVRVIVVKIGVLFIEANDFIKSVVGVEIAVVVAVEGLGLGLLHRVIKKLALKSFLALFSVFNFGWQLIQICLGFYFVIFALLFAFCLVVLE